MIGDGFAHIALSTPDLEALHQEHSAKGYEVTEPKGLPGTKPNYYFVKDPDGYKVEVIRENDPVKSSRMFVFLLDFFYFERVY